MTKEYSNEEFGFGSSAYAEPAAKREEDKIARSPSAPAKIQQAALTAAAPVAEAVTPTAPVASAAVLPPLPAASAGAPPAITNPADSADFWASALKGVGLPVGLGLAAGAGAGYLGSKLGNKGGQPTAVGTTGPSELEQVKIDRERFKFEQDMARAEREKASYEAKLAAQAKPSAQPVTGEIPQPTYPSGTTAQQPAITGYGQTNLNAPTGAPSVGTPPPPAEAQPVAPTAKEIAAQNAERRAEEMHQAKLEQIKAQTEASRAKASVKKDTPTQAAKTTGGTISPTDAALLANVERGKATAAAAEAQQKAIATAVKPPAATPAPATAAPTAPTAQAPAVPAGGVEPPKVAGKWPGGAEGSALQLFGGTKKNLTPGSMASLEMFKEHVGGPLTMPTTGGTIHQINEASKFYEKYTGEPLPRSPEGKLTRIPEEQIAKLHSGIQSELEAAVKGGKLQTLGKGAMAAAALLGLSTAVQAAQKGDFKPLQEAGFFAAAGAIPVVGQVIQGLSPSEVASGKLPKVEQQEQREKNILGKYNNRRELEAKIEGKSPAESNKIRSEFLKSAPTTDYEHMVKVFAQQAEAKKAKLKR